MESGQENNWRGYQLSGWWKRVGAYLIDGIIIGLIITLIVVALMFLAIIPFAGSDTDSDAAVAGVIIFILLASFFFSILTYVLYYGFSMARKGERNGQSFGKQIFKITVKKEDLTDIGFGYAVLRQFIVINLLFNTVGSFFTAGILPLLNYLWPLWDERRQALHDKMVGSRVVVEKNITYLPEISS